MENKTEIVEKLFRVQATLEHVLVAGRAEEMELSFLRRALDAQRAAIKLILTQERN